jgi:hypothetical protein
MDIERLRGMPRADQFREAAKFAEVSPSVFAGIARTESANGKHMLSPKGAEGWFGIMPTTKSTWENRTGLKLNPHDFTEGLYIAALTLKENMQKFGNVEDALRAYNGGTAKSNWNNKETREYVGKVLGNATAARNERAAAMSNKYQGVKDLNNLSVDQLWNTAEADLPKDRRPLDPALRDLPTATERFAAIVPTGNNINTNDRSISPQLNKDTSTANAAIARQKWADSLGIKDKLMATVAENTLTAGMVRMFTREYAEEDPNWSKTYSSAFKDFENVAQTQQEVNWLRESTSQADYERIVKEIGEKRARQATYGSDGSTSTLLWSLAGGVLDPAGWAAGLGVGKAAELAGIGSRAFLLGREATVGQTAVRQNIPAGLGALVGENIVGNVLTTAALDAAGEHMGVEDYAYSAAAGGLIAALSVPFHIKGIRDASLEQGFRDMQVAAAEKQAAKLEQAQNELGPDASKEQIRAKLQDYDNKEIVDHVRTSLADVPDAHRIMPLDPATAITSDPVKKADIHAKYDLAKVADTAERDMVGEIIAQGERIAKENPIDENGRKTFLAKVKAGSLHDQGMESTGLTLLNSESPTARSVSMMLTEGTTGAGGRRRTAAISSVFRERLYNQATHGVENLYHQWRKVNGYHIANEALNGKGYNEFNKRIFEAINARDVAGANLVDSDPIIAEAVNLYEKGFDLQRIEQQYVGTAGNERLGNTSVGYAPRRLDGRVVLGLTTPQHRAIRSVLKDQFLKLGWDDKFSERMSAEYIGHAINRAKGGYDIPFNLHDPESAEIVGDLLKTLRPEGVDKIDYEALLGKFSRGGATHTKGRLDININTPIPDADGVVRNMKLSDLYVQDMQSLYRSYARRTAGEVALAQYGVLGKKGLNMLREAIKADGGSVADLHAFDQISAEFLNTPFETAKNHKFMDNARLATSALKLGGMGFTQLAEYGNALSTLGVQATFNAIKDMPRLLKEVGQLKENGAAKNPILNSLETLGGNIGVDDFQMSRLFDVKDNDIQLYGTENLTVVDRALRASANANSILSGHRAILAVQVRGLSEQIIRKAIKMAKAGSDDVHLDDMGIHKELRDALRSDLDNIAKFDDKGNLTSLDFTDSTIEPSKIMELRTAIERGASQIIQRTYIGETGRWAHDGFLKLLLQFRTFGITSIEKQWGRAVRIGGGGTEGHIKAFATLVGSMSFALPIVLARAHWRTVGMSRSEREDYVKKNLTPAKLGMATLNYTSKSGLLSDFVDVGTSFAGGWGGDAGKDFANTVSARGASRGSLIGGMFGPAFGTIEDAWQGATGKNPHALMKLIPGSNLPYVQPFITAATSDDNK